MRGSTLRKKCITLKRGGCPAHAGIYPVHNHITFAPVRLPRACGDLPEPVLTPEGWSLAAPRMRGSTRAWYHSLSQEDGCPAHAGIYLMWPPRSMSKVRLPRACGDLPSLAAAARMSSPAAPRMRGSTLRVGDRQERIYGCPAHAGIYLSVPTESREYEWLPRACGDLPVIWLSRQCSVLAAPRMRGSTSVKAGKSTPWKGCPAHAGIYPIILIRPLSLKWLPRACGDLPYITYSGWWQDAAAPRMRGSTSRGGADRARPCGCPAHAGIYLWTNIPTAVLERLPRACGDLPIAVSVPLPHAEAAPRMRGSTSASPPAMHPMRGCPAHAGIYLKVTAGLRILDRLPRACGDLPYHHAIRLTVCVAAPRMRGSTLGRVVACECRFGCPAHAGIYHIHGSWCFATSWLPRACGDLPCRCAGVRQTFQAAPRMRGSTCHDHAVLAGCVGCPAHAGIYPGRRRVRSLRAGLPRACGDLPVAAMW